MIFCCFFALVSCVFHPTIDNGFIRGSCGEIETEFGKKTLLFSGKTALSWTHAQVYCFSLGMKLLDIQSYSENDRILGLLVEDSWIGLSSVFDNFRKNSLIEKKERGCVYVDHISGFWEEDKCKSKKSFVCSGEISCDTLFSEYEFGRVEEDNRGEIRRSQYTDSNLFEVSFFGGIIFLVTIICCVGMCGTIVCFPIAVMTFPVSIPFLVVVDVFCFVFLFLFLKEILSKNEEATDTFRGMRGEGGVVLVFVMLGSLIFSIGLAGYIMYVVCVVVVCFGIPAVILLCFLFPLIFCLTFIILKLMKKEKEEGEEEEYKADEELKKVDEENEEEREDEEQQLKKVDELHLDKDTPSETDSDEAEFNVDEPMIQTPTDELGKYDVENRV